MKSKRFWLLASMAAVVFGLPSCSSDSDTTESNNSVSPAELKITASMMPSIEVTTRAAYDLQGTTPEVFTDIGIYVWYTGCTAAKASAPAYAGYANDRVASYTDESGTGNGPFTLTPTTNTTMYFPVNNADVDVYLYAPYKSTPTQTNMCMEHTVAADQSLTAGYLDSDFIYGKATADYDALTDPKIAKVTMHHAMSKIIFIVDENGVFPTNMTDISIKNVYTKTTINMPVAVGANLTCGSGSTTYNVDEASVLGNIKVWDNNAGIGAVSVADTQTNGVAAVLPPQTTDASAKVSVTVDGKTATANFNGITVNPGYVYTYTLTLTGQTLVIKLISITDWVNGGSGTLDFNNWS